MWEKRIFHPGLKTFRVIRGAEQATVELKAKLQTDIWDERWQKIQLANSKRQKEDEVAKARFQQKELALQRTREAEKQLDSLTCILRDGIEIDHVLDWEQLKDKASFSEPKPEQPQHLSSSPPPLRGSAEFLPQLSLVDRLVPSRRSRRIAEAERRYQDAIDKWNVSEKRHRETIASQQSAYEEKLKEWTSKKTLHAIALAGQHAEVDATNLHYS
jgi:restriction system protein